MRDQKGDKEEILPHDYDGIQELNNPLPRWWLMTFYVTIVFSVFYYGYYEVFDGPTSDEYLAVSLEQIKKTQVKAEEKSQPGLFTNVKDLLANQEMMDVGKQHFASKCAACHGDQGQGLIGPNLTDKYWISSKGDLAGIIKAIEDGYPAKGMPAWKAMVPAFERPYLAAYVMKMQGTNPPNAKAPQGQEIK